MKSLSFIAVLLLTTSFTVFSQTFRLDVNNEPLNKVLNRLELEISFNDRALSEYGITVSQSFDNSEKALFWLLEDKPFRVEKIGKVHVIVPFDPLPPTDANVAFPYAENERIILHGTVVSQTTGEPLEYATVSLLSPDDQLLTSGITTDRGRFTIRTFRVPSKIKISHIGYETLSRPVQKWNDELGIFPLNEETILLDEVTVSAVHHKAEINHATYRASLLMRDGVDNALELLNNIPGAYFDKTSKAILLNHQENILLLVDGIQYAQDYLQHLSPRRIYAVEVIYAMSGRFVSDDYAGIINFILNKDYTGFDIHVSNISSFNLSKTADIGWAEHYPDIGITYANRKLNFFGSYSHEWEKRNIFTSKSLTHHTSDIVSFPTERPNSLSQQKKHIISGGMNYHIKPLQLLGIQADFVSGRSSSLQEYSLQRTDLSANQSRTFAYTTDNRIEANMFAVRLFYQGQVTNRLRLYGDLSYHYYYNVMENEYNSGYRYTDLWDEYKHQTVLNMEGAYLLSDKTTIEAGYANIWRQYASESSQGRGFLDYGEQRNKVFTYLSRLLSDKVGLKCGIALEHIRQRNGATEDDYLRVLPYLQFNYKINRTAALTVGYATGQSYPALYQLSPISIVIDTFVTQIGNPILKSAVKHQVYAELSIGNKLKITPQFNYINHGTGELYDWKDYKLYRTFDHIDFYEYSLHASYEQPLGTYFRLKNTVMLYHSEASNAGIRNTLNGWTCHAEADFYHPAASAGAQVGYYRNMRKNVLWQGYQMSDKDYWCVSLRKELWNNRISTTLSYIPPLAWGVRYNSVKEIETPLYKEHTTTHLASYNQMLLLKISFRFDSGSAKPAESRTAIQMNERETK